MKKKLIWLIGTVGILSIALIVFNATRTYTSEFIGPVSVDNPLPAELVSDLETNQIQILYAARQQYVLLGI